MTICNHVVCLAFFCFMSHDTCHSCRLLLLCTTSCQSNALHCFLKIFSSKSSLTLKKKRTSINGHLNPQLLHCCFKQIKVRVAPSYFQNKLPLSRLTNVVLGTQKNMHGGNTITDSSIVLIGGKCVKIITVQKNYWYSMLLPATVCGGSLGQW